MLLLLGTMHGRALLVTLYFSVYFVVLH